MTATIQASDRTLHGHALSVAGANKRYGLYAALDNVNLEITAGRFLVLLGPSGSGKTTLARCIAGVERLHGGSIRIAGAVVDDGRRQLPPERRDLAMLFQDYALWPHLTAVGNVEYALRRRHLARVEAHRRALQALEQVGLELLADRYPHQLSGGEQQRVALARAVVARPGLLLFDEPLSNLDADLRERLRVQIATLVRDSGATVVYITHDQAEAFALADDIAVLHRGKVVQFATPEDVYARPATLFVARFTGAAGELPGSVVAKDGAHVIVQVQGLRLRARNSGDLAVGSSARVLVRPAGTRIVAADRLDESTLRGTIVDVAYRGRGYDHVFRCDAGILTGIFAPSRWSRGSNVGVGIDPDSCVAYATVPDTAIDGVERRTPLGITTAETGVVDVVGTGLLAHETG